MKNIDDILFPSQYGYAPSFVLHRFNAILKTYGQEKVLLTGQFKKAREMWITATFLLAMNKDLGKSHWAIAENTAATPDTYGISIAKSTRFENASEENKTNFEITEWETHSGPDIIEDVIMKKINKAYPGYFVILIYARRTPGEKLNLEEIHQKLKLLKIKVSQICLLANTQGPKSDNHSAIILYPQRFHINYSLSEEAKKDEENNKAQIIERFMRQRGGIFEVPGKPTLFLPLPELKDI